MPYIAGLLANLSSQPMLSLLFKNTNYQVLIIRNSYYDYSIRTYEKMDQIHLSRETG